MSTAPAQYGLEPEDDAEEYSEAIVVNVTDEEVTFKIAQTPGSKARRYRLAPFGTPGSTVSIQEGYTQPYKGAGREMIEPIIERLTKRHAFHEGPRLPMVVHSDKARAARAAWLKAFADREEKMRAAPVTVAVKIDSVTRQPISAEVAHAPAAPAAKLAPKLIGEEVAQDEIEAPHPDDEPIADGPPPVGPVPETDDEPAPPTRRGRA